MNNEDRLNPAIWNKESQNHSTNHLFAAPLVHVVNMLLNCDCAVQYSSIFSILTML